MQVLIYFSVIMLRDVMNSGAEEITDLSDWCSKGRNIDIYLTSGAGSTDAKVSMIASKEPLNCTLTFKVKPENFIMLVVEYPDQTPKERVCFSQSNNSVLIRDYENDYNCQDDGKKTMYSASSQASLSVSVSSKGVMKTVKLTSTSMRESKQQSCYQIDETECIYKDVLYCMTSSILCDNNINCGVDYDEADDKCKELTMTFIMIISTFAMGSLSFILIGSAAYTAIPTRREIFIHAQDQSLGLFDCGDIVQSEIYFQELLPLEDDSNPQ